MRRLILIVLILILIGAGDRPENLARLRSNKNLQPIPVGAIRIPLPDVQQPDDESCGAAVMMSIFSYYGRAPKGIKNRGTRDVKAYKEKVHTGKDGTYYGDMIELAKELGLRAEKQPGMSLEKLKDYLDQGIPVVLSIQAYADDPGVYDNPDSNEDGHYVVAIGYDEENFYFMDPSSNYKGTPAKPLYGVLSKKELDKRWHDNEKAPRGKEIYHHLGIVIYPEKGEKPMLLRAIRIE